MKILLCNKFYYRRGGDCIVTINLEQLLKAKGHEVAIYSMDYPENISSTDSPTVARWKKYWPSNMSKIKAFTRPFGDGEVVDKFTRMLEDFQPDVVHLHNIHTHLSPVIAKIAHEKGIKVFWTLHDTKLVCPCYTCMREKTHPNPHLKGGDCHPEQGIKMEWCEECFTDKTAVIKHKCMPGGIIGSTIGYFEILKWNAEKLQRYTTKFLPPSQFMMDTCVRGGYDANKFEVLCNFIDIDKIPWYIEWKNKSLSADKFMSLSSDEQISSINPINSKKTINLLPKEDYYCFLGRVTEVKGIRTLCKAASQLPYKLKVIGGGDLLDELKQEFSNSQIRDNKVEFLGQMNWEEFRPILEGAKFMVLPSEWSENNPLTVIESQSLGTPVLGARIGGIPELIVENDSLSVDRDSLLVDKFMSLSDDSESLTVDEQITPINSIRSINSIPHINSKHCPVPNGMTFESGDVEDLKEKLQLMWDAEFDYEAIAKDAVARYSSEAYYEKLMEIYKG